MRCNDMAGVAFSLSRRAKTGVYDCHCYVFRLDTHLWSLSESGQSDQGAKTVKKYPFPAGVTSMSDADYREHCRKCADAERATRAANRAHLDAMRARRAETRASMPTARVAALKVGESVLLAGYQKTTQVSSAIRNAYIATGGRYTSRVQPDHLTGETVIGVTVTRTM